jgi:hypothetical protein
MSANQTTAKPLANAPARVRYKLRNLYWWKAHAEHKILVRLVAENEQYVAVRIMAIDTAAALRCGYGAHETVNLGKWNAPLEEVA